jgi:hypothetical protein
MARSYPFQPCLSGVGNACSYFFFVQGIELERPTRTAPSKNIVRGSDTEDVAEITKNGIIITTHKSNLYILHSGKRLYRFSYIMSLQISCHTVK